MGVTDSKHPDELAETLAPSPGLAATVADGGAATPVADFGRVDRYVIKQRLLDELVRWRDQHR